MYKKGAMRFEKEIRAQKIQYKGEENSSQGVEIGRIVKEKQRRFR